MVYKVRTKVGKKEFTRTFQKVSSVDKYLKGASDLRKTYPKPRPTATFWVNGRKVTKKY